MYLDYVRRVLHPHGILLRVNDRVYTRDLINRQTLWHPANEFSPLSHPEHWEVTSATRVVDGSKRLVFGGFESVSHAHHFIQRERGDALRSPAELVFDEHPPGVVMQPQREDPYGAWSVQRVITDTPSRGAALLDEQGRPRVRFYGHSDEQAEAAEEFLLHLREHYPKGLS